MDVGSSLVANFQAPVAVQPGVRSFDDPAMTAKSVLGLNALASNPRDDSAATQQLLVSFRLVSLVGMELVGAFARPTATTLDRRNRIQTLSEHRGLVDVGGRQQDRERDPLPVDHKMALRALFAAIRRILSGFFAPPGEATVEASIETRLQSMRSAWPRRSRKS